MRAPGTCRAAPSSLRAPTSSKSELRRAATAPAHPPIPYTRPGFVPALIRISRRGPSATRALPIIWDTPGNDFEKDTIMQHPHYAGPRSADLAAPAGRCSTDTPVRPRGCGAGAQLWIALPVHGFRVAVTDLLSAIRLAFKPDADRTIALLYWSCGATCVPAVLELYFVVALCWRARWPTPRAWPHIVSPRMGSATLREAPISWWQASATIFAARPSSDACSDVARGRPETASSLGRVCYLEISFDPRRSRTVRSHQTHAIQRAGARPSSDGYRAPRAAGRPHRCPALAPRAPYAWNL